MVTKEQMGMVNVGLQYFMERGWTTPLDEKGTPKSRI
jgi:hypothetical protein